MCVCVRVFELPSESGFLRQVTGEDPLSHTDLSCPCQATGMGLSCQAVMWFVCLYSVGEAHE